MLQFLSNLLSFIPNLIVAILLLIVALIAAKIVKGLVLKLLGMVHAEKYLEKLGVKDVSTGSATMFVAKLAYFVTFLLFLPGVLDRLGMQSVSSPITSMVHSFLDFIPKVVGAGLIVAIGVFVANLLRQLLISALRALKVDELQKKIGIQASDSNLFSTIVANVVYAGILLIVITSALEQLGINAISNPAKEIVATIFGIFPNVLGAILVIAVGVFIAQLVAKLLESLLAGVGTDTLLDKLPKSPKKTIVLSKAISAIVKYVLIVIFVVQGINILKLPVLTSIGSAIIAYMPQVLAAVIIIAIGFIAASAVEAALEKKGQTAKVGILAAKTAIYALTAVMCLSQLGIASAIVEKAFVLILAALCVAFAIAFGVGGRQFAANSLDKLEKKLEDKEEK